MELTLEGKKANNTHTYTQTYKKNHSTHTNTHITYIL